MGKGEHLFFHIRIRVLNFQKFTQSRSGLICFARLQMGGTPHQYDAGEISAVIF